MIFFLIFFSGISQVSTTMLVLNGSDTEISGFKNQIKLDAKLTALANNRAIKLTALKNNRAVKLLDLQHTTRRAL